MDKLPGQGSNVLLNTASARDGLHGGNNGHGAPGGASISLMSDGVVKQIPDAIPDAADPDIPSCPEKPLDMRVIVFQEGNPKQIKCFTDIFNSMKTEEVTSWFRIRAEGFADDRSARLAPDKYLEEISKHNYTSSSSNARIHAEIAVRWLSQSSLDITPNTIFSTLQSFSESLTRKHVCNALAPLFASVEPVKQASSVKTPGPEKKLSIAGQSQTDSVRPGGINPSYAANSKYSDKQIDSFLKKYANEPEVICFMGKTLTSEQNPIRRRASQIYILARLTFDNELQKQNRGFYQWFCSKMDELSENNSREVRSSRKTHCSKNIVYHCSENEGDTIDTRIQPFLEDCGVGVVIDFIHILDKSYQAPDISKCQNLGKQLIKDLSTRLRTHNTTLEKVVNTWESAQTQVRGNADSDKSKSNSRDSGKKKEAAGSASAEQQAVEDAVAMSNIIAGVVNLSTVLNCDMFLPANPQPGKPQGAGDEGSSTPPAGINSVSAEAESRRSSVEAGFGDEL